MGFRNAGRRIIKSTEEAQRNGKVVLEKTEHRQGWLVVFVRKRSSGCYGGQEGQETAELRNRRLLGFSFSFICVF